MRRLATLAIAAVLSAASPASAQDCATTPYDDPPTPALAALLDRALPVIARYPSLDDALVEISPTLCLSDEPSEAIAYFEPASNRIVIDAGRAPDLQFVTLIHELRHVEQHLRGICPDTSLAMREYARAIWALESDATTIGLIVAWDMRERGDPGPWRALADLPRYADIARGFAAIMEESGDLAAASEAAFTLWYANAERRGAYYIASCSAYLDEQDRTNMLPRYGTLAAGFFDALCVLPDGTRFDCTEPLPLPPR